MAPIHKRLFIILGTESYYVLKVTRKRQKRGKKETKKHMVPT